MLLTNMLFTERDCVKMLCNVDMYLLEVVVVVIRCLCLQHASQTCLHL